MFKIVKYILADILKSRVILAYTIFLATISTSLYLLDSNPDKSTISLVNINLIIIPLMSIIFTTIHYYNSYEFIELLVAQPISRNRIVMSEYVAVTLSLLIAFMAGVGIPIILFNMNTAGWSVIYSGLMITIIFSSLAFLCSVLTRDKTRGIGAALLVWLFFSIIYDGLILFILFSFNDYPIEPLIMVITHLNPVDLARIFMLIRLDVSAMMGYTGALYLEYFGATTGMFLSSIVMVLWAVIPVTIGVKVFRNKDL
ncbi:MAG TPA: ABC transporter permease subunit [Bacteroidia bacterium]|nr:ABC transporter permease subunit [Bacteroidia bacterium]